jgi:hypothetical protein
MPEKRRDRSKTDPRLREIARLVRVERTLAASVLLYIAAILLLFCLIGFVPGPLHDYAQRERLLQKRSSGRPGSDARHSPSRSGIPDVGAIVRPRPNGEYQDQYVSPRSPWISAGQQLS